MKSRISYKLIFAVGCATMVIVGLFAFLTLDSHKRQLIQQIEASAYLLSETVRNSTRHDMLTNRFEDVHQIIETIGRQEGIEKVRVFNKEGAVIFSTQPADIGKMVDKQAEACYGCHNASQPLTRLDLPDRTRTFTTVAGSRNLGVVSPIYNEPDCWQADCHAHSPEQSVLGVLDITMSLTGVDQQILHGTRSMLILAVSAIGSISVILWLLVHRLVGVPVTLLVNATTAVANGDLTYRVALNQNDELGNLARSFNQMTQKLHDTQEQLYQSEKLASLGRLAAGVAHEINNPLTGVLTYSSFLLKRADDTPELKQDLEVVVRETKRCREIVNGLLNFSRQTPAQKSNVEIGHVIQKTLTILQHQLKSQQVTVTSDAPADLPVIHADGNQLQQVLINLLLNAVDAMPESGGEIKITTQNRARNHQPGLEIEVADNGCGIPHEHLSKIFEPFFTTKGQKGTGLGLAVVWGIINKHSGVIEVKSEAGAGTTMTIFLPIST